MFPTDISQDGQWLLVMGDPNTRLVPLGDTDVEQPPAHRALRGRVSPDGALIAYISDHTGRMEVYVEPLKGQAGRVQVSIDGGTNPVWAPDGSQLFFQQPIVGMPLGGTKMMVVDVTDPNWLDRPQPRLLFETADNFENFDVTPEGDRFLLKTLPAEMPPTHVIMNWPREQQLGR